MYELVLEGCQPEPLMAYLKALGVLRLVAEQADPQARGAWWNDRFVLRSKLDEQTLVSFFLNHYRPTPVVAPWAGGSGFFAQDNKEALEKIVASTTPRLDAYRNVIQAVRKILQDLDIKTKPADVQKQNLLRLYRRKLPDEFVQWMDCALALQSEGQTYAPILGTGGNDGRLDFTQHFMQRLVDVILEATSESYDWLRNALFGTHCRNLLSKPVGQFDPGRVGGPNATQGTEGGSIVNPWDFVLMIEGAILMAGSVARRMGEAQGEKAVFPFTTAASWCGHGTIGQEDSSEARGEIWLPLWQRFVSLVELKQTFSEGRAEVGRRQSRDGVEFARAVASLGVDMGFRSFVRYGFLKRSGKCYLAAPLGHFSVEAKPEADLLQQLETHGWLEILRWACKARNVPPRFPAALRRLDAAIFDFCRYGGKPRFAEILCAVGRIEQELALLHGKVGERNVRPAPLLSDDWIEACNDGTREFRIGLAVASIWGEADVGPLRTYVEPTALQGPWYTWVETSESVAWRAGSLCASLAAVLDRRLVEAHRHTHALEGLPIEAACRLQWDDIAAFLAGLTDDRRIEELLWGAMLIDLRHCSPRTLSADSIEADLWLSRTYALLKLLFLPKRLSLQSESGKAVRPEPAILAHLRAGDITGACEIAARRLRASGFIPMPGPTSGGAKRPMRYLTDIEGIRLAAALLLPVADSRYLIDLVLRPKVELAETLEQ